jgi:hypothetical protein
MCGLIKDFYGTHDISVPIYWLYFCSGLTIFFFVDTAIMLRKIYDQREYERNYLDTAIMLRKIYNQRENEKRNTFTTYEEDMESDEENNESDEENNESDEENNESDEENNESDEENNESDEETSSYSESENNENNQEETSLTQQECHTGEEDAVFTPEMSSELASLINKLEKNTSIISKTLSKKYGEKIHDSVDCKDVAVDPAIEEPVLPDNTLI